MKIQIGNKIRSNKIFAGDNEYPKVLASIGASNPDNDLGQEIIKAKIAKQFGADIIIDHTLLPKYNEIHKKLIEAVDLPLSTIAVYDRAADLNESKKYFTEDEVLKGIEEKGKIGIDMLTIHASVRYEDLKYFYSNERIIPCTSRGGIMVLNNMRTTGKDNFYYSYFDDIVNIAKKYSITLSLGAVYRSANIFDAVNNNGKYWEEIEINSFLAKKAVDQGVSVMIEGIGHCPINLIPEVVRKSKEISKVPYRVLTVSTDCALGFDHVASAIAASTAVCAGADFVTAVSRAEHLGLPDVGDLKEAVISAKVAAHAGYIARTGDISADQRMANERKKMGCRGSVQASIVPELTKEELKRHKLAEDKKCTMCGKFCALSGGDNLK